MRFGGTDASNWVSIPPSVGEQSVVFRTQTFLNKREKSLNKYRAIKIPCFKSTVLKKYRRLKIPSFTLLLFLQAFSN